MEREARSVKIHELDMFEVNVPYLRFRVVCSKGTYIRTLAHDIGDALGCGAHLTQLARTKIGSFGVESAFSLSHLVQLAQPDERAQCLIPIYQALAFLPSLQIAEAEATRLCHGSQVLLNAEQMAQFTDSQIANQVFRVCRPDSNFIALARMMSSKQNGEEQWQLQPIKVFGLNR